MGMPPKPEKGFHEIDFRVGVTAMLSVIVYNLLCMLSENITNYVNVCILAICVIFLADINWKTTWKAGLTRIMITFIGALVALIPVTVYNVTQSEVILVPVFGIGAVVAIVLAKFTGGMYVQCRLAIVSYILTVFTFHESYYAAMGKSCYGYCLMWMISTVLGVVISVACAFVWDMVKSIFVKEAKAQTTA